MYWILTWAIIATIALLTMIVIHFAHPYPLIQVPDRGHRLYGVPPLHHATIVELLRHGGWRVFGTFVAGVRQTLFCDGFTIIASGQGIDAGGISIPCEDPEKAAAFAQRFLGDRGVRSEIWRPSETGLRGKIAVVKLPWGWGIAYRLPGRKMPWPKWE